MRKTNIRCALLAIASLLTATSTANAAGYTFTTLDPPTSTFTLPSGINDAGQIVGSFTVGTIFHGFLYAGDSFTQIDVPGEFATEAHGINNLGQIVGNATSGPSVDHGFLYTGGSFTQIDVPGILNTQP